MTPDLKDRIYQGISRAVIWGAERAEVMHTLEVNGISGAEADDLFNRARTERINLIRAEAVRKALLGMLLLIAAIGLYMLFWYGFGAITRLVYIICFGVGAWGVWWSVDGVICMIFASSKKGPVS